MKRFLVVLIVVLASLCWAMPAVAQTATQQIRIEDSGGHPIANANVTLYVHGQPHTTPNIVATGTTDADGYVQPAPSLTPGTIYDFVTTDGRVPSGQFTAVAPTQLNLIPGHGSTTTTGAVTGPAVNGSLTIAVADSQAFPPNSYVALVDNVNTLAPPAAPSVSAIAGTSAVAQTIYVVVTYLNGSGGQTTVSPQTSIALTTVQQAQVGSPVASGNATTYDVYAGTASGGPYFLQNASPVTIGTSFTIPGTLLTATAAPTFNTTAHAAYGYITSTSATNSTITETVQAYGGGAGAGTAFTVGSAVTFAGQPGVAGCTNNCAVTNANNSFATQQTISGNVTIPAAGTATSGTNYGSLGSLALQNSSWVSGAATTGTWSLNADSLKNLRAQWNGTTEASISPAGVVSTGTTTLGPTAFNFGGVAGLMSSGADDSAGVGGSWQLEWLSNEASPDAWSWYVNGSNGGGSLPSHSLNLYYLPADHTLASSFPAISISPLTSNHDELDANGGSMTFYPNAAFNGGLSSAKSITAAAPFFGNTTVNGIVGSALMQASITGGHVDLADAGGTLLFDASDASVIFQGLTFSPGSIAMTSAGNVNLNANGVGSGVRVNYGGAATVGLSVYDGGTTNNYSLVYGTGLTEGTSLYGPTSTAVNGPLTAGSSAVAVGSSLAAASVTGNANNPQAILMPNADGAGYVTYIGTNAADTLQGYNCNDLRVGQWNGTASSTDLCVGNLGNLGVRGNVTATNFFTGSRAAWKTNIEPFRFDALGVLERTHYAEYDCKTARCGTVGEHKVGIIADDTPAQISGGKHDHYDAFAMAAIDGRAIVELADQVRQLERAVKAMCRLPQNRRLKECAKRR